MTFQICHQIAERSFCWDGSCLPLCARCTGIILGFVVGLLLPLWWPLTFRLRYALFILGLNSVTLFVPALDTNVVRLLLGLLLGGVSTMRWGRLLGQRAGRWSHAAKRPAR
jgi:uncharacterized membrane protein